MTCKKILANKISLPIKAQYMLSFLSSSMLYPQR